MSDINGKDFTPRYHIGKTKATAYCGVKLRDLDKLDAGNRPFKTIEQMIAETCPHCLKEWADEIWAVTDASL